ncbi:hypothetical protein [Mycolicibacterium pyrenivorans]|uniref:hypothetical protein n=1 Tax=Mycolicibacterium pyrenivorans TaxID=187102 RepID=UPI0021F3859F|nr:hypothetical protein [Mycolicibacterium pyrenivorans]MCV7150678.1 hypothetical protein [Mycolicibacterium pyrenivorans]
MSKAARKTRRRRTAALKSSPGVTVAEFFRLRLTNPDPRSHAEYLADMRAKQAAGPLSNPATAALLDRLERAVG